MFERLLQELGARAFVEKQDESASRSSESHETPSLVMNHLKLLHLFEGAAVVFDKGAKFRTNEPSPLNDKEGYQGLEMLFGLGNGKNSISKKMKMYEGELPNGYIPIGEAPGGNIVCVDASGCVFVWNHESARDESPCQVCNSFDEFLNRLVPDDVDIGNTDGIIESESFLDF